MAAASIPFNPEFLETYGIIRSTPAWKDVKESMKRLEELRKPAAKPYDQMDLDRDNVLRYAAILGNSANSITYGICLAAHLARFSNEPAFDQRLLGGFRALSTGLDLPALGETDTKTELVRCAGAAFPDLKIELVPLVAPTPAPEAAPADAAPNAAATPEAAPADAAPNAAAPEEAAPAEAVPEEAAPSKPASDPWRAALETALAKIRDAEPMDIGSVVARASQAWQTRLQSFLSGQPEVPPDMDYLRCRARNLPLGMILRGRLKNVTLREWSETYVAGMSEAPALPVPIWFALAALGALGFDVPRELNSIKPEEERKAASQFVTSLSQTSPPKGLIILRVTAESQTAAWSISPSMPALIVKPEEAMLEGKANLQSYFQPRLHGVLIEVGRDEQPAAALARAGLNLLQDRLPSVRFGLLMATQPQNAAAVQNRPYAVMPADAMAAYTQAFAPAPTPTSSAPPPHAPPQPRSPAP